MLSQLVPRRNRTFPRSARAPSRFIDHAASAHIGTPSLERPVIGYEAPHARPTLIADPCFAAALASCAGARLTAKHGASSRGIQPESKPAPCGCEYLSS